MSAKSSATPRNCRTRRLVGLVTASLVIVAIAVVVVAWLSGGVQQRTVGDLLNSSVEIHPVEATADLCSAPGCVEGWRTDVGDYLRFESVGEAEYWATVLGDDGRRWENIVLDLGEERMSEDQRRLAIDVLYSWHDWN